MARDCPAGLCYPSGFTTHKYLDCVFFIGGINDQLGKGFHRYSTDDRWHVPHFEKMLYDQGQLAVSLADTYAVC